MSAENKELTARETEIYGLVARGLTNRQIAKQLGISPFTAKFHVFNLMDKLNVHTRVEAAISYIQRNCTCGLSGTCTTK